MELRFCHLLAVLFFFGANAQNSVLAQRVFSNSRPGASANVRTGYQGRTATGGFSTGRSSNSTRWGIPGAPARTDWTLRTPTYSNSRSATSGYDALPQSNRSSQYGGRAPIRHYSTPHHHPHSDGHHGGPIVYGSRGYGYGYQGYLNPYNQVRILNGLPLRYSNGYGGFVGIATPPIVIPYGGFPAQFPSQPLTFNPNSTLPAPPQQALPPNPEAAGQTFAQPIAVDNAPIIDEFFVARPQAGGAVVPTVDKIRALRYQTSGDSEFRRGDYAAAAVLYQTSAKTAPERRAPWLRRAWAEVCLRDFEEATRSLKTALLLQDDPTSSWIPGEQLYGKNFANDAALQNNELLRWLEQRPKSTDRLLLAAAFQQLQGYAGTSRELINTALQNGLNRDIVDAFEQIAHDLFENIQQQNQARPKGQPLPPADAPLPDTNIQGGNVIGTGQTIEGDSAGERALTSQPQTPRAFVAPSPEQAEPSGNRELPLTIPVAE